MPQGLERMHAGSSPYSTAPFHLWKFGAGDLSFYAPIHHPTTVGNDSAALRHLVFLLHLYQSHPVRSGGSCAPRKTDARHYARSHRAGPCGIGLDRPFFARYVDWVWNCLQGDFGVSYTNPSRTVLGELGRCLPATLSLAGLSLVYVIVLSLPIGFLSAVYKDSWFDRIMHGIVFATTAMPAYWVGLLLIWFVSIKLDLLPTSGSGTFAHLILPAFTVALTYISTYIRLIRNNMLENMREDYVLYARVRGLKEGSILVKHVLKNSLQSCVTAIGMSIPQLIAGTIVVENVFAWPGLGKLCITSIFNRDYPVIQAYVLMMGVLFVIFNLLFDIIQCAVDPRLRKQETA